MTGRTKSSVSSAIAAAIAAASSSAANPSAKAALPICQVLVRSSSGDRLGRSLQHLVELLNELQALHCNLYLHQQAIDTTTPSGKAMFQMCGVFAEFERAMIVERVNSGLARAKAKGVKLGRGNKKDGDRSADEQRWGMSRAELEKRILRLHKRGTGILKIGKTLGIGTGTVQRVLMEQPRPFDVDVAEAARAYQ